MTGLLQDVRYALRQLRKSPGFTVVAVITLALGIGASTAIFTLVNSVILHALPYEEPERLVQLWEDPSGKGQEKNSVAGAEFADWKEHATTLEGVSVIRRENLNLTGAGRPERVRVQKVSANYLNVLRVKPFVGRGFLPEEESAGKNQVVVLSHRFWARYFQSAPEIVGRTVQLDSRAYTVAGILPPTPELPMDCDILTPFVYGSEPWHLLRTDHRLRVIARMKPGVTLEQVRAEMNSIAQQMKPQYPRWKQNWGVTVLSLHQQITGAIRPQLWVLFGAVALVLLVACANVAGLLLARMLVRQREIAIRASLGAGRWRVIRQLITESLILSSSAGALGVLLAISVVSLFKRLGPDILPRMNEVTIDWQILGFTLLLSLATGIAFGLAPALHAARPDLNDSLKQDSHASRRSGVTLRGGLTAAEIAIALVLLVGAGLLLETLFRLQAVPSGFNPHNVVAADISFDDHKHPRGNERSTFLNRIIERLETLPGVQTAGTITDLPMEGPADTAVRAEKQPDRDESYIGTDYSFVSGHLFQATGIPLLKGRFFENTDDSTDARRVAILNAALAKRTFPNEDPIGQNIRMWNESWQVVGVVGDVRQRGLDVDVREHIYVPQVFSPYSSVLVVRTKLAASAVAEPLRSEILKLDSEQPISNLRTLEQVVAFTSSRRLLMFQLLVAFAIIALLLAAVGLYGVMAYSVSQRTREIGIRMALGANRGKVLALILSQGLKFTLLGVGMGLAGAFALTRVLKHFLFAVSPQDPAVFAGTALILFIVSCLSCWLPAYCAAKADPIVALRSE